MDFFRFWRCRFFIYWIFLLSKNEIVHYGEKCILHPDYSYYSLRNFINFVSSSYFFYKRKITIPVTSIQKYIYVSYNLKLTKRIQYLSIMVKSKMYSDWYRTNYRTTTLDENSVLLLNYDKIRIKKKNNSYL